MLEKIRETRLDNGVVILTDKMEGVRSATLGFFFRVGARHEPEELHGITHFIEHAVFKGTARRSALDIAIEQDRLGGNLDAFTTHEEVGFAVKVVDEETAAGFDLIADMLANPKFDDADLEAEQRVIIEELKMVDDSPEDALGDIFNAEFFAGDPLGRNISGTAETIRAFGSEVTREYHARAFTSENLVVVAAGNVGHDEVVALAQSASFSSFRRDGDDNLKLALSTPEPAAPFIIKQRPDLEQAHLIIATPFVGATDDRRYAADLLGTVIGGGTSSRLWQKVREERGLAYSVGAGAVMYQDVGVFSISAATSPEHAAEVTDLAVTELREIVANGITNDELDLAKQQAVTSVLLSLEDSSSRAAALAQSETVHGRQISVEETLAGITAVSVDDCYAIANEFFRSEDVAFVALGDLKTVDITRASLRI
jgi:predicted Zn-dependent peptidase